MNKLLKIGFLILATFSYSQSKELSIKLDKNKRAFNVNASHTRGDLYVTASNGVETDFMKFDKNLNEVFKIQLSEFPVNFSFPYFSGHGYYALGNNIIDSIGGIREYPMNHRYIEEKSELNPIFSFFSHYGYSVIGPKIGRKNIKKKYSDGDLSIYNYRNLDLKGEKFPINTPQITTNQKIPEWFLSSVLKNSFFLYSKDDFNNDFNKTVFHLANFNYSGEVLSNTKINFSLDEGKYFLPTRNFGSFDKIKTPDLLEDYSYLCSYINENDNSILFYGYYSNKNGKQMRVAKIEGIYAYKFNIETGELIWKSYFPFKKIESSYLIKRSINYAFNGDKSIISCSIDEDLATMIVVDNKTGKIEESSSSLSSFFKNDKAIKNKYFIDLSKKNTKINGNHITKSAFAAMLVKPEIKEFIKNKASNKSNARYEAKFFKNGDMFILVDKNKKTELDIYKF